MAQGVYNVTQLAEQIGNFMRDYARVTQEEVNEIAEQIAKRGAIKLRMKTTGGFSTEGTGDYRKGWRAKKEKGVWIVHNKTDYQLTHLLEKGHDIKDSNGRKVGEAKAFPHIEAVEQELIEEFEREIYEVLTR